MFTRELDANGKPVLNVSTMDGGVVKSLPLDGMDDGQRRSIDFPGGKLTVEQGTNGGQLYTASSNGRTEMVAYNGGQLTESEASNSATTSSGMQQTTVNGQPGAQIASGLMVGADGKSFYDSNNVPISLDSTGQGLLADGQTINVSTMPGGATHVSLANANNQGFDSYLITSDANSLSIDHSDSQNHPSDTLSMTKDASGAFHSSSYNFGSQPVQASDNGGSSRLLGLLMPGVQDLPRESNSAAVQAPAAAAADISTLMTNYSGNDSSQSPNHYMLANNDIVGDAPVQSLSAPQTTYNQSDSLVSSPNFSDGVSTPASVAQYDRNETFVPNDSQDNRFAALNGDDTSSPTSNRVINPFDGSYAAGARTDTSNAAYNTSATAPQQVSGNTLERVYSEQTASANVVAPSSVISSAQSEQTQATQPQYSQTQFSQPQYQQAQPEQTPLEQPQFARPQYEQTQNEVGARSKEVQSDTISLQQPNLLSQSTAETQLKLGQESVSGEVIQSSAQPEVRRHAFFSMTPAHDAFSLQGPTDQCSPAREFVEQLSLSAIIASTHQRRDEKSFVDPHQGAFRTNQTLEQQTISARRGAPVPKSALSSVLGKARSASCSDQKPSEFLTSALVDYHSICDLIQLGNVREAEMLSAAALSNLSKCDGNEPQLLPLIRAFVVLFEQKNMVHQANAFRSKEESLKQFVTTAAKPAQNIWGA
jgi:hypothetical protein